LQFNEFEDGQKYQGKRASHYTMSQLFGLGDNKQEMVKKANKKKSLGSQIVKFFISTHL
jgi:hypothetical protein